MEKKDQLNPNTADDSNKGTENTDVKIEVTEEKKSETTSNQTEVQDENSKEEVTEEKPEETKDKLTEEPKVEAVDKETTVPKEDKESKSELTKENQEDASIVKPDLEAEKAQDVVHKEKQEAKPVQNEGSDELDEEEDMTEKYANLTKQELVDAIEALVDNDDVAYIRKHIGYIKAAFRKLLKAENLDKYEKSMDADSVPEKEEQEDPLVVRFDKAFEQYKEKKADFDRNFEKQKQENLAAKEQILSNLRGLIESDEELKHTYDMFRDLQEKWKQIGPVPQNAKSTLWNNYHFLVEKFFDKVKINKELKDLDLKKNQEAKLELCEKAEALMLENSITKSFQQLQKLHEAWKETGPVPNDMKDMLWERFKAASDKLNQRRQDFYDNLREEQKKNYAAKLVLCEKAEQILENLPENARDWKGSTDQVNELFKVWKTIGYAPKKVNDEVWNRFIGAVDKFFKSKKTFFKQFKEQLNENYNQKVNLCIQAEAIKDSEDWKQTTDALIALQQEWKKIGPVPGKHSDKIWKRFREACDHFFNRKSEYFANKGEKQSENLQKKLELIEKIKNHEYSDDKSANLKVLNDFQREWMEIGHVPIKQKDKIYKEFRQAINDQFDKLKISQKAQKTFSFKSKLENIKNNPNADNIINKERSFILSRINNLQNDIKVWENNIGFFASSKKADVLKKEFEDKINKAREDIKVFEEKLRILQQEQ